MRFLPRMRKAVRRRNGRRQNDAPGTDGTGGGVSSPQCCIVQPGWNSSQESPYARNYPGIRHPSQIRGKIRGMAIFSLMHIHKKIYAFGVELLVRMDFSFA